MPKDNVIIGPFAAEAPKQCVITMDGEHTVAEDFVAIIPEGNNKVAAYYNTDALTLGRAAQLVANLFFDVLASQAKGEKDEILHSLNLEEGIKLNGRN